MLPHRGTSSHDAGLHMQNGVGAQGARLGLTCRCFRLTAFPHKLTDARRRFYLCFWQSLPVLGYRPCQWGSFVCGNALPIKQTATFQVERRREMRSRREAVCERGRLVWYLNAIKRGRQGKADLRMYLSRMASQTCLLNERVCMEELDALLQASRVDKLRR